MQRPAGASETQSAEALNAKSSRATASRDPRGAFPHFHEISTRWMDNDVYGHVNNVVYYSFFDTVVNRYLIDNGALDIAKR